MFLGVYKCLCVWSMFDTSVFVCVHWKIRKIRKLVIFYRRLQFPRRVTAHLLLTTNIFPSCFFLPSLAKLFDDLFSFFFSFPSFKSTRINFEDYEMAAFQQC